MVSGRAQPLGFRPSFSSRGQPSGVGGLYLSSRTISGQRVSCQHKTQASSPSRRSKARKEFLGKICLGQGLFLRGVGHLGE